MKYDEIPAADAHALFSSGGIIWVCTKSLEGVYNLAPVAWNCVLDYEPTSRVAFVLDPKHLSFENIVAAHECALALPCFNQKKLVMRSGSISGREGDKYANLRIPAFPAKEVDALVPEGVAGWLECELMQVVTVDNARLMLMEVKHAAAVKDAWKKRLYYADGTTFFKAGSALTR